MKTLKRGKIKKMKNSYDNNMSEAQLEDWFKTNGWSREMQERIISTNKSLACMFAEAALSSSAKIGQLEPALDRLSSVNLYSRSTNLKLNLFRCDINAAQTQKLSEVISGMKYLNSITLNMADNNVGEEGALSLGRALGELQQLRSLNLNFQSNKLGDNGLKNLLKGFENNRHNISLDSLQLSLEKNRIGNNSLKKLGQLFMTSLKGITALTLRLSFNDAEDAAALELACGIKALLPCMTYCKIKLGFNKIGPTGKEKLAEALGTVPHFLSFDL